MTAHQPDTADLALREQIARVIAASLIEQDGGYGDPANPFDGCDDLTWSYIDQGCVDFGQIADAILASLPAQVGERPSPVLWINLRGQQGEPAGSMVVTAGLADGSEVELIKDNGNIISHSKNVRALFAHPVPEQSVDVKHGDVRVWQHEGVWIAHDTKRDIQVQADNLAKLCALFADAVFLDPGAYPEQEAV